MPAPNASNRPIIKLTVTVPVAARAPATAKNTPAPTAAIAMASFLAASLTSSLKPVKSAVLLDVSCLYLLRLPLYFSFR
jgi:hypothetical protein